MQIDVNSIPIITIDGYSASGKGTLCKKLNDILNWNILYSGNIYRVLALKLLGKSFLKLNIEEILNLIKKLIIKFERKEKFIKTVCNGRDLTKDIQKEDVVMLASKISCIKEVRDSLLIYQRKFLNPPGLIAEGRDLGTVVFPNASIKIFLNTSLKKRAKRRKKQLKFFGINEDLKKILKNMKERDEIDKKRNFSPTKPAKDALIFDSGKLKVNKIIERIIFHMKNIINV
ncbi:MAG: (d)CMP kinase [Enterobacteriaceae bacterium]